MGPGAEGVTDALIHKQQVSEFETLGLQRGGAVPLEMRNLRPQRLTCVAKTVHKPCQPLTWVL